VLARPLERLWLLPDQLLQLGDGLHPSAGSRGDGRGGWQEQGRTAAMLDAPTWCGTPGQRDDWAWQKKGAKWSQALTHPHVHLQQRVY